ncbi:hypothetical protein NDU88_003657 [Pleurodeles waltl]|uniref:Uncharacterized protein n=1 Tax=Pleurodeles waltl TaxID=8319 RepID=A0AAV7SGL2_PLEWA|nr:hypothetical protein NDU88_003657 [Pleurodeles waltl]
MLARRPLGAGKVMDGRGPNPWLRALQRSRGRATLPEAVAAVLRAALWMRQAAAESRRLLGAATLSEEACLEPGRRCRAGECAVPAAKERLGDLDPPRPWPVVRAVAWGGGGQSAGKRSWRFPALLPEPPPRN